MQTYFYLSHGGPGSGRYPLGSGDRPYQKYEGTGRRRFSIGGYLKERKAKKIETQRFEAAKKANEAKAKAAKEKAVRDQNKEKVLMGGSAKDVWKYQGELTNQELRRVVDRLDLEAKIKDYKAKEEKTPTYFEKLDKYSKNTKTTAEFIKNGAELYNIAASVYNASPKGQAHPMTLVKMPGGGGGGDKKK